MREVAELRLMIPDASLRGVREMLTPKVGKSGINHRLRKLDKIADDHRNSNKKLNASHAQDE